MIKKGTKVIVTTDKDRRGVFYGTLEDFDKDKKECVLIKARMVVYWSEETKGVLGLASIGPQKGSKVSPFVEEIELDGVTAIIKCSKESIKVFKKEEIWN